MGSNSRDGKGADVEVVGGKHPSTYEGSNWKPGNNFADYKVFALLNLERFHEAISVSELLIKLRNGETNSDYIIAGLGYWSLSNYSQAITLWRTGRKSKYKDAAGGLDIEIILFYAGLKTKQLAIVNESRSAILLLRN